MKSYVFASRGNITNNVTNLIEEFKQKDGTYVNKFSEVKEGEKSQCNNKNKSQKSAKNK